MNVASGKSAASSNPNARCLARSVADSFAQEPALEAVTIDRARKTISIATLGRTDVETLTRRLTEKIRAVQGADPPCRLLEGADDCAACQEPLSETERKKILIRRSAESLTLARVTCLTAPQFWRWRDVPLPRVVPREIEIHEGDRGIDEWKTQLVAAVLCGVFGLAGVFTPAPLKIVFYLAAYLAGGWFTAREVWERLRQRVIDVHFLMLAVATGAAAIGAWGEGATLLFLFSLSGALEHFALGRTQKEIRALFREAPKFATVLDDAGNEFEMAVEDIRPGMKLLIRPGAQFPVDGEIAKGATAADESNLTGEATPVEKKIGDTVLAGTLNLWGAVEVVATKPAAESALQKIIKLIREAQRQKAPAQRFTERFSSIYTYVVIGLSLAMFFVWWLGFGLTPFSVAGGDEHSAFYRTMTLLVVSSPCALVLSIPSAILAAIAFGARHGILFRGGAAVEKLAETKIIALDKTGTLTTGELRVEAIESFPPGHENEIARLAYSLEKLSTHPLARAITRYGKQQHLVPVALDHFESVTGHGLRARGDGREVLLGQRDWVLKNAGFSPAGIAPNALPPEKEAAISEIWIARGDLLGRILLRDDIRPQARAVVDELHAEKLKTVVLTGDKASAAAYLRAQLHLDDVRAELKPEQKVAAIRELSAREKVAMVGDGVNDAPSLAAAHVGVAMGARGADAALEQADVVLMHDRLENFLAAFRLSRRARKIIRQNLVISLGTVVVLVAFALLGKIPLTLGVVGHEGSTVVVVMNSLRLLLGGNKS
jgi:Cd2+/Zn2+-exporting ATPase